MNEKEFLKKLNSKENKDGFKTEYIVMELLTESDTSIAINKKRGILERIFSRRKKIKTRKEIMSDNLELIFRKLPGGCFQNFLEFTMKFPEIQDVIKEKFDVVLKAMNNTKEKLGNSYWIIKYKIFERLMKEANNPSEFLEKNVDSIIHYTPEMELFHIAQIIKGKSDIVDNKLNSALEVTMNKYPPMIERLYNLDETTKIEYSNIISTMVNELVRSEKKRYIDIDEIDSGSMSNVYKIGEKIIKVGEKRRTYEIPNHSRILQPLVRENMVDENGKVVGCIEISDAVDKIEYEEQDEEKLYNLYKELRNDGIVWTDVDFRNVGKLKKENMPTLEGESFKNVPKFVGLIGEEKGKTLSAGDWVILDTDYIFFENDKNIRYSDKGYAHVFENRYRNEKNSINNVEIRKSNFAKTNNYKENVREDR